MAQSAGGRRIVILTGAGLSAESGLGTFRDTDGLWSKYDLNEVATPEGFDANPALVHEFYNLRRRKLLAAAPNAAHVALAELEQEIGRRGGAVLTVTQNIDDLHERAGAKNVTHMHGELLKARCAGCGAVSEWRDDLSVDLECARCGGAGGMRPHVVWFGEVPLGLDEIIEAVTTADLFVAIGTSGSVYPAAGFVGEARGLGVPCVELNMEPSDNHYLFTDKKYGPASEIVPQWVRDTLAE